MSDAPAGFVMASPERPGYLFQAQKLTADQDQAWKARDPNVFGEHAWMTDPDETEKHFDTKYENGELKDETKEMDKRTFSKPVPSIEEFAVLLPAAMGDICVVEPTSATLGGVVVGQNWPLLTRSYLIFCGRFAGIRRSRGNNAGERCRRHDGSCSGGLLREPSAVRTRR